MKRGTEPNEEEGERTIREIEKGLREVNKKGKGKDRQRRLISNAFDLHSKALRKGHI